ncbi:sodium-dependent bicarbonate transport family permease [Haloferula rosea]|uniref:Sodium-dependent bicarbonate transport family permease n=1 Tax=Haloferula rosea TaxID=490093 RepID=A0A934RCK4_9BACT|nr:sodium-dependent bicarbonate transport family permease [Haloferula rosea]MBK1828070.1 sodium-dependent bicarbonate transport family permease [Haloferula rosea]
MEALTTVLNPGVLFFILGFVAVLLKSNLSIPEPVVRFLSLYLMLSIGFKGGISLYHSTLSGDGIVIIGIIIGMSALVPFYSYLLLKRPLGVADAAAIGATYGSNSTLTYITAAGFLTSIGQTYEGYMTVALVVMETPAIIISVIMAQCAMKTKATKSTSMVIRESLTDGTLIVLVGSMGIGYVLTALGTEASPLAAFIEGDMFTGMLVFFLLYMGTVVGRKVRELDHFPPLLLAFAIAAPVVNGLIAIGLCMIFGFEHGDALLLTILCASASYIVAPAILKDTLPEANPAKFLTMSMGITFPLNIVIGIPVYWWMIERLV